MRITENRMMELATRDMSKARADVARSSEVLSSGVRVARPSDDPVAWATGRQSANRALLSERRESALARAHEHLQSTDAALDGVGVSLSSVRELAIQLANGIYDDRQRAEGAAQVRALRDAAVTSANGRGPNGEYVLAGTLTATPPFLAGGVYVGDANVRRIEVGEGHLDAVTVPGTVLTAAGGTDVFAVLEAVAVALENNDVPGLQATLVGLSDSIDQVADARTEVGTRMATVEHSQARTEDLKLLLANTIDREIGADPVEAAAEFSRFSLALEASRAAAQQIISLARSFFR